MLLLLRVLNLLRIGNILNSTHGNKGVFDGIIDDVRIWNTARTQSEIQANFNRELTGNESGLVGYWNFNSINGNTVQDLSRNQNNGSLFGAQPVPRIVSRIIDDSIYEPTETVNLTISNPTGGATLGTQQTATLSIIDNDAIPGVIQFSGATYSVNENGTPVTAVTLTRTNGSDGAVSVTVNLTNGTATAGSDYNNTPITVNFANGETTKTVTIPIVNDTQFELDETVNLSLSNPTGGATLGTQTTAVLTIVESITPTVEIANSQTEFSGLQGQNKWYYGYYDGPFNSSDFQQMTQFSSSAWYVQNGTYWTQLWANGGHSNGQITSGGRLSVQQWAVRRWVSEIDGVVQLSGSLRFTGGGSTIGKIFVGGTEFLSQVVNTQTSNYNLRVAVQKGSFVDFALDPKDNNDLGDSTEFTAKIFSNITPQHGILNFSNYQISVNENNGTASITLTRSGEVTVKLALL
ncbi:MAG UNVERIFIED_CONTAM: hypothetical protein LVR29_05990 [Microcystis novacekii LVE1205-3]|jgi:hypothetical protein